MIGGKSVPMHELPTPAEMRDKIIEMGECLQSLTNKMRAWNQKRLDVNIGADQLEVAKVTLWDEIETRQKEANGLQLTIMKMYARFPMEYTSYTEYTGELDLYLHNLDMFSSMTENMMKILSDV